VDVDGSRGEFLVGAKVKVTARVSLGGLPPGDVRVQAYYGVLTADGQIGKGSHVDLGLRQSSGAEHVYEGEVECRESGSCGFAVRVVPFQEDAILPYELPWIRWEE
jgi:starch phosphorylase